MLAQVPRDRLACDQSSKETVAPVFAAPATPARSPTGAFAPVIRKNTPGNIQVKHWIEIELRGEDFSPVAGEKFKVRLPDQSFVKGYLDEHGLARVDDILEPGACQIFFPGLDQDAWARTRTHQTPEFPASLVSAGKKKAPGRYSLESGENIHSIAFQAGHVWSTIWNAPENGTLRQVRTDPSVLAEKDSLFIPELRLRQEIGATNKRHCFKRIGVPSILRFRPMYLGEPFVYQPYVVTSNSADAGRGTTTDQGIVECYVTPDAKEASITIGTGYFRFTYHITLRTLAPVETTDGLIARLQQLGFFESEKSSEDAIAAFRDYHGMQAGTVVDKQVLHALLCDFGR
jgi:hypothetical protein